MITDALERRAGTNRGGKNLGITFARCGMAQETRPRIAPVRHPRGTNCSRTGQGGAPAATRRGVRQFAP